MCARRFALTSRRRLVWLRCCFGCFFGCFFGRYCFGFLFPIGGILSSRGRGGLGCVDASDRAIRDVNHLLPFRSLGMAPRTASIIAGIITCPGMCFGAILCVWLGSRCSGGSCPGGRIVRLGWRAGSQTCCRADPVVRVPLVSTERIERPGHGSSRNGQKFRDLAVSHPSSRAVTRSSQLSAS